MEVVAIVLSLFSIAVSITTFMAVMAIQTRKETGISITEVLKKPVESPNKVTDDTSTTELENFTPNFTKPVSVKFL